MNTIFINDVEFELVPLQEYKPKSSEWPVYYMKEDNEVAWMEPGTCYAIRPLQKVALNQPLQAKEGQE